MSTKPSENSQPFYEPPKGQMKRPSSSRRVLPKLAVAETIALVLFPLCLLVLICAINFPNEFHLHGLAELGASVFAVAGHGTVTFSTSNLQASSQPPDFRLFMGILTLADRYEERHRLRLLHSLQPPVTAQIDIKFVLCNLTSDEQRVLVALEIMRYEDIIILHCWENMRKGKTYAYFSSLPGLLKDADEDKPYDFVMKTDDDTFFRFPELVESLRNQPREDLYWGHHVPPINDVPSFMAGMGYVLSWDLVEWIAKSDIARNNTIGPEDRTVAGWLRAGGKGKNAYSTQGKRLNFDTKLVMYDYPYLPWTYVPNTISVHRLKDRNKWAETLSYFNFTAGVKPSKFYHGLQLDGFNYTHVFTG